MRSIMKLSKLNQIQGVLVTAGRSDLALIIAKNIEGMINYCDLILDLRIAGNSESSLHIDVDEGDRYTITEKDSGTPAKEHYDEWIGQLEFIIKKLKKEKDKSNVSIKTYKSGYELNSRVLAKKTKSKNEYTKLEKNKVPLTDEERVLVMEREAIWNHGPNGEATPAVWKSVDKKTGDTTYITNTHRAWNKAPTLKGAINRYHRFIKSTAFTQGVEL